MTDTDRAERLVWDAIANLNQLASMGLPAIRATETHLVELELVTRNIRAAIARAQEAA